MGRDGGGRHDRAGADQASKSGGLADDSRRPEFRGQ